MRVAHAALAALLGTAAQADGFSVYDLGGMPSREACIQAAQKVLGRYLREQGGFEVVVNDWVIYGWDFGPGDNDVALQCPIFPGDYVNAMLVVYGEGDGEAADADRMFVADTIEAMWFGE